MEVHHHPNLHHQPKPWKEYLLEGLMIFMAVTLGFFAESYREHLADHSKEKQYLHSFLEDIKKDTATINIAALKSYKLSLRMDTLAILISNYHDSNDNKELYRVFMSVCQYYPFSPTERTIAQLKNSGGLRLITNTTIANEIADYDNAISHLKEYTETYKEFTFRMAFLSQEIFKQTYFKYYSLASNYQNAFKADSLFVIDPSYRNQHLGLIGTDPVLFARFANSLKIAEFVSTDYVRMQRDFKARGIKLIALLKREYNL